MKIRFKDCGGVLQALFVTVLCGIVSLHAGLTDPAACSDDEDSLSMNLSDVSGGPVSDLESTVSEEDLSVEFEVLKIRESNQLDAKDDGVSLTACHHVKTCLDLFKQAAKIFDWGNGKPDEETLSLYVQNTVYITEMLLLERKRCTCDWELNWINQFIASLVDQLLWCQRTFILNDSVFSNLKCNK